MMHLAKRLFHSFNASRLTPGNGLSSYSQTPAASNAHAAPRPYPHEGQALIPGTGANPFSWLAYFLALGRTMHLPVADAFITRQDSGYYHYERHSDYHTCAVAAAYAGAFGRESIEAQGFSPSLAKWRLSYLIGVDLEGVLVTGPTGRTQPVLDEMIALVDTDKWSRAGIAEWLYSLGGP